MITQPLHNQVIRFSKQIGHILVDNTYSPTNATVAVKNAKNGTIIVMNYKAKKTSGGATLYAYESTSASLSTIVTPTVDAVIQQTTASTKFLQIAQEIVIEDDEIEFAKKANTLLNMIYLCDPRNMSTLTTVHSSDGKAEIIFPTPKPVS